MQPLNRQLLLDARPAVEAVGELGTQLSILSSRPKVKAATLDQLLLQSSFPVPVRALDGAVLVGDAAVVAGGRDAQVGAELAVPAGEVLGVASIVIAVAGAEAVDTVFYRHPATAAQGILQRLGQSYETLTAVDHLHATPA